MLAGELLLELSCNAVITGEQFPYEIKNRKRVAHTGVDQRKKMSLPVFPRVCRAP
jgi:hypothetical protein